jgi:hypothetical protein
MIKPFLFRPSHATLMDHAGKTAWPGGAPTRQLNNKTLP